MYLKRRMEVALCKHKWHPRTVSATELSCECKICGVIKRSKKIIWAPIFDPQKPIRP